VQVFRNLLENAIRYSPENGNIVAEYTNPGHESLFGIRDDGPGILWQHQQRVFERFYRLEKDRKSRFGSTGLGLAICRHILNNHGGRIWVQSPNPGSPNGTTIFFTLERPSDENDRPH
jgi:two-component system phosphate regulon sensor histidine kinase PhoR